MISGCSTAGETTAVAAEIRPLCHACKALAVRWIWAEIPGLSEGLLELTDWVEADDLDPVENEVVCAKSAVCDSEICAAVLMPDLLKQFDGQPSIEFRPVEPRVVVL